MRGADVFVDPDPRRPGQRVDHGAARDDRRDEAGLRQAHHRRDPVLRVRAAGQEGARPRADQREAARRPADGRRREPRRVDRPARGTDPGLLRLPRSTTSRPCRCSPSTSRTSSGSTATIVVVVAPDAGRIKTAERLREYLHADLAFLYKRRVGREAHKIEEMAVVGEVEGRPCILIDDMIDTAEHGREGRERARAAGGRSDLRGRDPPGAVGQGGPEPGGGADRRGGRHEHDADPGREAVRQAEGALDRAARRRARCGRCSRTAASPRSSTARTSSGRSRDRTTTRAPPFAERRRLPARLPARSRRDAGPRTRRWSRLRASSPAGTSPRPSWHAPAST